MAQPRNFSDDGAAGAFGGGDALGPDHVSDPGPGGSAPSSSSATSSSSAIPDFGPSTAAYYGMGLAGLPGTPGNVSGQTTPKPPAASGEIPGFGPSTASYYSMGLAGLPSSGTYTNPQMEMLTGQPLSVGYGNQGGALAFAEGGEVPGEAPDDGDTGGGDNLVGLALASVDSALAYGRNKYGLGGDQQTAANLPARPGTQSPNAPGPAPGPLVPTANPFGKRQGQPFGRTAQNQGAIPDDGDEDDEESA